MTKDIWLVIAFIATMVCAAIALVIENPPPS
jgi:hypothetical protein